MSTTSSLDSAHINESIKQILSTDLGERIMENHFGSRLSTHIFDSHDPSSYNLVRYEIQEALKEFEPRIEVTEQDIDITEGQNDRGENTLIISIFYKVIKHNSDHTVSVEIGG